MTITSTSVDLSWTAPAGGAPANGYGVVYRQTGTTPWTLAAWGAASPATVAGLLPSTNYDLSVFAIGLAGPGAIATPIQRMTLGLVPGIPTGLAASAGSPSYSAASLSWTAPTVDSTHGTPVSYTVQYRVTGAGSWTTGPTGVTGTTATVTGLAHATGYDFQVFAVNSTGNGAATATATLTTTTAAPNIPTGLTAGSLTGLTTSSVVMTWTAPTTDSTHDAATTYTLQYKPTSGSTWTQITGISGTSQTVTGLSSATSYDFQVRAVNAGGSSGYTATTASTTYTNSIVVGIYSPNYLSDTSPPHNGSPGCNVSITPTPNNVRGTFGTSGTTEPSSGWQAFSNYSGNLWGQYLTAPATAGSYYLWIEARDGSNNVTGLNVSGPYTVT